MRLAPDGSPVELYRRLPERNDEAQLIDEMLGQPGEVLDLGCGTGRLAEPLCRAGHRVVGIDDEPAMLDELKLAEGIAGDVASLDLGRRFDAVLLMSHFVNTADMDLVAGYLDTVSRHLKPAGFAIIERYQPGWVTTCTDGTARRDGITYSLQVLDRTQDVLTAAMRYEVDGDAAEQRFSARDVDDATLAELVAGAGLSVTSVLDEAATLVALRPVAADVR